MSIIGKNRLAIYDLFYRYPPCDYIYNKKLNVLIIGNGWVTKRLKLCSGMVSIRMLN